MNILSIFHQRQTMRHLRFIKTNHKHSFVSGLLLLLVLSGLPGCGGVGGSESRPPLPGVQLAGVASVRQSAIGPREASAEAEVVIANATIRFEVSGSAVANTTTNAQGEYKMYIPPNVRGVLVLTQENRRLTAIVTPARETGGTVKRDISLESTVVELALHNLNSLSYDVEAMEEQVLIGETTDLYNEVKNAYLNNRLPVSDTTVLEKTLATLQTGEGIATNDCLAGQEWCLAFNRIVPGTGNLTYTVNLLLRRDRTGGRESDLSTATVGAGSALVRLPSGVSIQSISGSAVTEDTVLADSGSTSTENEIEIGFVHPLAAGFNEATKVATLTLTSIRPLTNEDRLIVVDRHLLGVLNENRSSVNVP